MTRITPIRSIARPTVLILSLAMTACAAQQRQSADTSTELFNALELYRSGEFQKAELALETIYDSDTTGIIDQRRALSAAILIELERNTGASLGEAQTLLDRFSRLNAGPIEPEYYLLRESLSTALNAKRESKSQHDAAIAARRSLDTAQSERRQLEATLKKLRELSLE